MFGIKYIEGWDKFFSRLDNSEKKKILKKIEQLPYLKNPRHLKHGSPNFVVESGQNRICFREKGKTRFILFAGSLKQYEKWLKI